MRRRRCQNCTRPMGLFATLLRFWSCKDCAYRMSMGGSPLRPPPSAPLAGAESAGPRAG